MRRHNLNYMLALPVLGLALPLVLSPGGTREAFTARVSTIDVCQFLFFILFVPCTALVCLLTAMRATGPGAVSVRRIALWGTPICLLLHIPFTLHYLNSIECGIVIRAWMPSPSACVSAFGTPLLLGWFAAMSMGAWRADALAPPGDVR